MTLQEKLDAYKADFVKKVPPAALSIMHKATETLAKSGIMDHVTKVGDTAPHFTLKNQQDRKVSLSGLLEKGSVVLGFYRGRW